jgi:hypothetical protein
MKIGFLTFEQFHKRNNIGSSNIRVYNLLPYLPEGELYKFGGRYDVMVYQKAYWVDHAKEFKGIKILDLCDPDFLHWSYKFREMIEECHAVTTSTIELALYIKKLCPDKEVWCIPDRINLNETDLKKDHKGNGLTKKIGWFGYSENFPMLDAAISALIDLRMEELIVVANKSKPYELPAGFKDKIRVINLPWTKETVFSDLLKCDVVVNPRATTGRWKYKSNNKTITAWKLGLPVAHNKDELKVLLTEESRIAEAEKRYKEVIDEYNIEKSASELRDLIEVLKINN